MKSSTLRAVLKPGDTLDRYTIDSILGQGGMGTVYRAHDTRLERRVAIKVITDATSAESEAAGRLLREARAAAALDHPNAVSIFDVGELGGAPYIVMELVTGRTLRDAVQSGSTPISRRVTWLADVARALSAAHSRGLVHRDIKPENVMVRDDGVVKVLDFGIARRAQGGVDPSGPTQQGTSLPTLTKEGVKIGTPLYMAPEQIRSEKLDGRVDQFAWGVLAFELLTGKLPWRGIMDPLAVAASILTDTPDSAALDAAGVAPFVRAVVLRALSKDPNDRFATMAELALALEAPANGQVEADRPAALVARPASATAMHRYSTGEVRAVLARAIERQEELRADSRVGFQDLIEAAREVGVDEGVLREASRELRERADAAEKNADVAFWIRRKRRAFYQHLGIYLIVSFVFVIFGIMTNALFGMLQVPLWWGIGVGIHALYAFMADEDDFREKLERDAKKARKLRRREQAVDKMIEQGASALLTAGATINRRMRVDSVEEGRVRVPSGAGRTQEAEIEAQAIEADADAEAAARKRERR